MVKKSPSRNAPVMFDAEPSPWNRFAWRSAGFRLIAGEYACRPRDAEAEDGANDGLIRSPVGVISRKRRLMRTHRLRLIIIWKPAESILPAWLTP
jgi:hypothetical protein